MAPKFVPRERKHKKIARQKEQETATNGATEDEGTAKVSGKKRKRLEKYIETKLKREENLELLKKLAAQKVDTSLLQSSRKLGRVRESKREQFQRALKEREAGIDVNGDQESILFEKRATVNTPETRQISEPAEELPIPSQAVLPPINASRPLDGFGLGLKRPLDVDEYGKPVIARRKRHEPEPKAPPALVLNAASSDIEGEDEESGEGGKSEESDYDDDDSGSEWNGFDSSDEVASSEQKPRTEQTQSRATTKLRKEEEVGKTKESEEHVDSGYGDDESDDSNEEDAEVTDDDDESDNEAAANKPARVSAFKAWANSQRNQALGFTPSIAPTNDTAVDIDFKPRAPSPDPDAEAALQTTTAASSFRPSAAIAISRPEKIQTARLELPVVQDEQKIMEAVHGNPVVIICGATGSGKTTQIPQILLENGYASYGMIGITQPRRVAATSVASRVAVELGNEYGKKVAHQVRYDSNVGRNTDIKFMTDGILLREISQDFALSKYSAIVIDEAHERSVNTDILIGMLSRIVPLRQELSQEQPNKHKPLKLIIMSATLRVSDFLLNERLFRGAKPPLVQIEGRQFQVTEHFARRTQRDYVIETVRKVSRGHKKLPVGGILVFLTGQDEIQTVVKQLKEVFRDESIGFQNSSHRTASHAAQNSSNDYLEDQDGNESDSEAEIQGLDDYDEDEEFVIPEEDDKAQPRGSLKAHILPLYAALPPDQQKRVFEPAPEGSRAIVLATNVAETSLTIPGIRYVFDCGRSKEKTYDVSNGVQEFKIDWISKASASQRMGRAGRTGPGHCYRLYSSAIFEQYFEEHTVPEILRSPIESTVLQLKSMDVENVVGFPFPTPPSAEQLMQAERLLRNLGAIDAASGKVTRVGRELVQFPVNPRFGKILYLGLLNKVLPLTIALVAGLAVGDLFIPPPSISNPAANRTIANADDESSDEDRRRNALNSAGLTAAQERQEAYSRANAKMAAFDAVADAIKILTAVAAHADEEEPASIREFCQNYFIREKQMSEVQQLRRQLHNIMLSQVRDGSVGPFQKKLPPPSKKQVAIIKQIVAGGYVDQVAIRADLLPSAPKVKPGRRAIEVPYRTVLPSSFELHAQASLEQREEQKNVYVHPSSVLARLSVSEMPAYIVYSDLSRATAKTLSQEPKKTRMRPLTTLSRKQLAALAEGTPLLEIGKPIGKIEEKDIGRRRECWVNIALRDPAASGTTGWPLGAWKVLQARQGKDWVIEKVISRGES